MSKKMQIRNKLQKIFHVYPVNNLKNVCQNARIKLTNNATIKEANFTPRLTHEKCMKKSIRNLNMTSVYTPYVHTTWVCFI